MDFYLGFFLLLCSVFALASGFTENLPTLSFEEGYSTLFGDDNLMVLKDGKSVHASLNERTGPFPPFFFPSSCSTYINIQRMQFIFFNKSVYFICRFWICVTRPLSSWVLQCFYQATRRLHCWCCCCFLCEFLFTLFSLFKLKANFTSTFACHIYFSL